MRCLVRPGRGFDSDADSDPDQDARYLCSGSLEDLEDEGAAHAAAGTHGHASGGESTTTQLVDHRDHHADAGGRDRMAEAAAAAVDVHDAGVDPEDAVGGDRNRVERFVDLEQIDIAD